MTPKLYIISVSPAVRAVLMVAKEIGLNLDLEEVDFASGAHLKPEFLKMNPTHTVPTLDDDGFTLWDSHAILVYLIQKYAKNDALYPKEITANAVINQMLHFETGTLFSRLAKITRPIWLSGKKVIDQPDKDAVIESYEFLESILDGKLWVAGGNSYSVADYSLVATISTLNVLVPIESQKFVNVMSWWKRCEDSLPGYDMNREGLEGFTKYMKDFLK